MTSSTTLILMLYFIQGSMGNGVGNPGGYPMNIEDAPFVVTLMHVDTETNETKLWWKGSIVHKQFVLTSSKSLSIPNIVRVGSSYFNKGGKLHQVEKYICHESSIHTPLNNVALVKLTEPVTFGPSVAAIKLADDSVSITVGLTANVTGWGGSEEGWESRGLRRVSVTVSPPDDCNKFYHRHGTKLSDHEICFKNEFNEACLNDDGAPLTVGDLQIGMGSYGAACWGLPMVYEQVAPHLQWIRNTIKQNL